MLADDVRRVLRVFPDFPKPGIAFQDVTPLLREQELFARVADAMAAPFADRVDVVAAIEARGFLFGVPIAERLGAAFVPIRKTGKLPGRAWREEYQLEYGRAVLEMQHDALRAGERVLIVDDVLATGGTALAARRLAERAGARVVGCSFLLEIGALGGRAQLGDDARVLLTV